MSKTSVKRSFDCLVRDQRHQKAQCTPHPIRFLQSPISKRVRKEEGFEMSGDDTKMEVKSPERKSPFQSATTANIDETLLKLTRKRKPKKEEKVNEKEPTFTFSQVRKILQDALAERERRLRGEYDETLNKLLREQFDVFTRFNEDYISRQFKRTDCSYLS